MLAAEFPETNDAIERGQLVDKEVSRELLGGDLATDPDARACLKQLAAFGLTEPRSALFVQERIAVHDPDSGEVLTEGTPDIVKLSGSTVIVVDLKKREQWFAGRLLEPNRNLQLHAYGLAWALRLGASSYKLGLLLFGDSDASFVWSEDFRKTQCNVYLDRIRRINESDARRDPARRPRPHAGPHCVQCYSRLHCPAWLLPVVEGENSALKVLSSPGGLSRDNAGQALTAVMALEEAAERARALLREFVHQTGEPIAVGDREWGPVTIPGRKSGPSVAELEKAGLSHLVKQGRPFEQWRMQLRKER